MAYDPQRDRRRPRPDERDPAPVDAILGGDTDPTNPAGPGLSLVDDPPPTPAVTPDPADPPSDRQLLSAGLMGAAAGIVVLVIARQVWVRRRRAAAEPTAD